MTDTTDRTLYERLGGREGIARLVPDLIDLHLANPAVGARFRNARKDTTEQIRLATEFLCSGLSGIDTYDGLPMADAHTGMQISDAEYIAVLDDILAALDMHGIGDVEKAEVLFLAYQLKSEIIGKWHGAWHEGVATLHRIRAGDSGQTSWHAWV